MPDKYCIASGDFNDSLIWSLEPGGPGGAGVPQNGEDIVFERSVTVENFYLPITSPGNVCIRNDADVCLVNTATELGMFRISDEYSLEVDGTLDFKISEMVISAKGNLQNTGTIRSSNNKRCVFGVVGVHPKESRLGRMGIVRFRMAPNAKEYAYRAFKGASQIDLLHYSIASGRPGLTTEFFEGDGRIGKLQFDNEGVIVRIDQHGRFLLTGDVTGSFPDRIQWNQAPGAESFFSGTSDQSIAMPSSVIGQKWTVDKPAGKLDLVRFDGFLQGRVRHLIVRASSNVDLSGAPPYLETSTGERACFYGLAADACLPDPSVPAPGVDDHLREALDLCENYGLITIPSGKTICAKQLKNHTGARISGDGTLCVRYGGLENSGTIDPTIEVRYFDTPVAATLSAPETAYTYENYFVNLSGSRGTLFRMDWGDGTFSETETPDALSHVYAVPPGNVGKWTSFSRTLCLTAINSEGSVHTATKTITVRATPFTLDLSLTPAAGSVPLTVVASVLSEFEYVYTFDWGNGHVIGPVDSKTVEYTYYEEGLYNVSVMAVDILRNRALSTTCSLTVSSPPPLPLARLQIDAWYGETPHEIVADTSASSGETLSVDWGDGTTSGRIALTDEVRHTFEEPGRYLVVLTVWDDRERSTTASQVVQVTDSREVRAVLEILPPTGYAPLTVLADASESYADEYVFSWGDGRSDDPSGKFAKTHTYTVPGLYHVVLTATKNGVIRSATADVVVLLPSSTPGPEPSDDGQNGSGSEIHSTGIPRDRMPFPYRFALAQGVHFMPDALQLHCPMNEAGRALENGSGLYLARIAHSDGTPISSNEIASASYSVFRLDASDPALRIPVEGHTDIPLTVADILLSEPATDENWTFDGIGYNFHHIPDDSVLSPFPMAGRNYLVCYTLHPVESRPKIQIRYRVHVI